MFSRRLFSFSLGAATVGLWAPGARAKPRFAWPDGRAAAVSLTYDDSLNGQLDIAAPQLEARGLKATFFLTQENMQARQADWMALAARGHEVGDHTVTHPCELRPYSPYRFDRTQLGPMESYLDAHFSRPGPRLYAYPCGATELGGHGSANRRQSDYVRLLRRRFDAARIVDGGPNDPRLVWRFRYLLQAFAPTYEVDDPKAAFDYVQRAIDHGYWAILIFHDIVDERREAGETSRVTHAAILDWIAAHPVWCAPMGEVFGKITKVGA